MLDVFMIGVFVNSMSVYSGFGGLVLGCSILRPRSLVIKAKSTFVYLYNLNIPLNFLILKRNTHTYIYI